MSETPIVTILLIDDDDKSRRHYRDRLKRGFPDAVLMEAWDGRSGLELCRKHRIDCVILELALPDMSGFEVLLWLIPLPKTPVMPVVVLTRLTSPLLSDLSKTNGAFACLVKHRSDDLEQVLRQALYTGQAGEDP